MMAWQVVVLSVATMAMFCFYKWCNTNLSISVNHRAIMESQAEIAQRNVEYARLSGSNAPNPTNN